MNVNVISIKLSKGACIKCKQQLYKTHFNKPIFVSSFLIYLFIWVGVTNEQAPCTLTYLLQLSPKSGPCVFWVCSCQFYQFAVWRPLSFCSRQSCTPPVRPPTDSIHLRKTGKRHHLWRHLSTHNKHNNTCNLISRIGNKRVLNKTWIWNWLLSDVDKKKALIGVITQTLLLHNPVNTGDYFGAEEDIISGVKWKCHISKNNEKK